MPLSGDKKDKQVPHGKLEEWLQLPESDGEYQPGALEEFPDDANIPEVLEEVTLGAFEGPCDEPPDETEEPDASEITVDPEYQVASENQDVTETQDIPEDMTLFPGYDSAEPETPGSAVFSDEEIADGGETAGEADESFAEIAGSIEHIEKLEEILVREFSDTLTGPNALTLPFGILLLLLSVIGWFLHPLIDLLGFTQLPSRIYLIVLPVSAAMSLAGIHLAFYWVVHRVSNGVKSRELDRLIEERREKQTCMYLDCIEAEEIQDKGEVEEHEGDKGEKADELELSDDNEAVEPVLVWQCSLFHIDLEDLPVCAVCDRYEPHPPPEMEITISRETGKPSS